MIRSRDLLKSEPVHIECRRQSQSKPTRLSLLGGQILGYCLMWLGFFVDIISEALRQGKWGTVGVSGHLNMQLRIIYIHD